MGIVKDVYLVSHTHWDREWYLTREKFRLMLVELIDNLLMTLDENDNFKAFMLDGQAIIFEDYFAMRPENEGRLREYINSGRVLIGPWYVLPDELLISGEAHIRNYLIGDEVCRKLGNKMEIGYLPDSFGHPSQMPQIIRGLGLKELIFWRGVGPEIKKTEFNWRGPDGSEILAINMPYGYGTAACMPKEKEHFIRRFKKEAERLAAINDVGAILLMNGVDHLAPQGHIPDMLDNCREQLSDYNIIHATLPEYISAVKNKITNLQSYTGELRASQKAYLLGGTISTRMYLKQANHEAEQLIEKWAEPMAVLAWTKGMKYPYGELKQLWKYALSNLPHDSICGCSIDEVHEEMLTRYKYLKELGESILDKSFNFIIDNIDISHKNYDGTLVVFNSLEHSRSENVQAVMEISPELIRKVDFDRGELIEYPFNENRELPRGIEIYDKNGNRVETKLIKTQKVVKMKLSLDTQPEMYEVLRLDVEFRANSVPAVGYDTYHYNLLFEKAGENNYSSDFILENEFFKVEFKEYGGTIDILDKKNNRTYAGCNRFVSEGDAGDEYTFSPPLRDSDYIMEKESVQLEWIEKSKLKQSAAVIGWLEVPRSLSDDRKERNSERVKCKVKSVITLYPGVARIDVITEIENNAEDHRLRVMFPTGIKTDYAHAEGIFSVDSRKVNRSNEEGDYSDWIEAPIKTHPQKTFVDVNNGELGLTIANKGISEYEVFEKDEESVIALTLLRCVGWLSRPDLLTRKGNGGWTIPTPGAQCLGKHSFEYSIIPHAGNYLEGKVHIEAHNFNTPLKALVKNNEHGTLKNSFSLIELQSDAIVLSAIKKAEKSEELLLRFYNSSNGDISTEIKLNVDVEKAVNSTLNEERLNEIDIRNNTIKVDFKPWEIKTLIFKLGRCNG